MPMLVSLFGAALFAPATAQSAGPAPAPSEKIATTQPRVERLNKLLAKVCREHDTPGIAAAVITSSGLRASGVHGKRAVGSPERITLADRFHLGSCTKSMTATLCAMLVEQGKLSWDQTPAKTWPALASKLHADFRDVTLKQLVCHRAGLPDDHSPDLRVWAKVLALTGDMREQRKSFVELYLSRPPAAKPGSAFAYSNTGFVVAGAMAEAATGESYEAMLQRMLFDPVGMASAGFGPPEGSQPRGHDAVLGMYVPVKPGPTADNPAVIAPAGTVHASIEDWARYAQLHLNAARGHHRLLSEKTYKCLYEDPFDQGYAYGWATLEQDWGGGQILAHDGSNGRWYAVVMIAPKRDLAFLVATNAADDTAQSAVREALTVLQKRFIPDDPTPDAEK